jgi:hypothetical protein
MPLINGMRLRLQFVLCLLALVPCIGSAKENAATVSPVELVRQAVRNEVQANENPSARFMCRDERKTVHLNQVKLLVETKDATAGLIIANDGHPLSPQEREQEQARLANYVRNPDELNRKRKQEADDADRTMRILKALPDAFLYEEDGTEKGTATIGRAGDDLVRLKFRPNPAYDPPTRVEQVLTGMGGYLLVDVAEKRIAVIDGTLQKDVGFGWGLLGHLDRGGHFLVQQADVGGDHWEITHMELAMTGKILLVKKLNIQSTETFSDFRPVPFDLTFAQGVELLQKEAVEVDANGKSRGPSSKTSAGREASNSSRSTASQHSSRGN